MAARRTRNQKTNNNRTASGFPALVIKAVFIALLAAFLVMVYRQVDAEDVSLDIVRDRLTADMDLDGMEECDGRALKQFIGIEPSEYEDFIYYKGSEALSVEELLIIKVEDKETLDGLLDRVENRVASQTAAFEGYGPSQVRLLNDAVYMKKGNFLFYCVSEDEAGYEEVFRDVV